MDYLLGIGQSSQPTHCLLASQEQPCVTIRTSGKFLGEYATSLIHNWLNVEPGPAQRAFLASDLLPSAP
jgi:hypothetical protein